MRRPGAQREPGGERGFALIIVLWVLVLIAFVVAHMTAQGRTEARIARNLAANAEARAAADGAVFEAIFYLLHPDPARRWLADGTPHDIQVGGVRVAVRAEDEAGRINPSLASPQLVKALLEVLGSDADAAAQLSDSIAEWVGTSPVARPPEMALADYRAAGLDYGPPGEPLESDDELAKVRGMSPDLLARLRPYLTAFGPAQPKRSAAGPVVAAALDRAQKASGGKPLFPGPGDADTATVRIYAAAADPNGGAATRLAVARLDKALPRGYAMLFWGTPRD